MLMFYSNKRISKWGFWHKKGKWPFCITVGVSIGLVIYAIFLTLFIISGSYLSVARMIGATLAIALGGTVIGWMAWYENEEKYDHWLKSQKKK
ncbi:hypothetical protein [Paludibacter sp.]|uniref:hypothetical protein n=1 Tax=Paludibacter sp. TaxID=1898105 RepID=UPI00135334BA|nr:hypothetical protein [Paludibacter sp.]MTK52087.1 hypothetical protein [Paludibacter sp.]